MSRKKMVLIIFGAIALVTMCGFSLGKFDYYFTDPWSDNDGRIHRDVKKYLKRKYNEEFIINEIRHSPAFMYEYYDISVSPKNNPEFIFSVGKARRGTSDDNYVAMLLLPQIEERFIEITDKYFNDYKYYLPFSPTINAPSSFMDGYSKSTTFQEVIDNRTRLGWFNGVYLYVNEKYDEKKGSITFSVG